MVTTEEIRAVVDTIVDHFKPQAVILFGSYATGHATEESDLDLLVIKETDLPRHRRLIGLGKKLSRVLVHPMDILVYTPDEILSRSDFEHDFITRVLKEGELIYGHKTHGH